jgi:predicted acetyltransferase
MAEWFEFDAATAYDSSFQWERGCIAYLATLDERPAGFALIGPAEGGAIHDVHEFFVLPESQRSGVGRAMAVRVWDEHAGEWRVRVIEANSSATAFWRLVP